MRPTQELLTTGHGRPPGLMPRRTKCTGILHPQLKISSSAFEAQGGQFSPQRRDAQESQKRKLSETRKWTLKRKFRVHATVSEQELLLVENFLQLRESRINEGARNLKRPRLSEQEFSTPESQELIKRDSPILESDCIDTNFRKKGWDFKSQSSSSSKTNSSAGSPLAMPVPVPKTLSNVKATSEWALRRTSYKGGNRRSLKRQKGNIQEGDARLEPLKTVPSCDILQWIETLIGSSLRTTHKKMAIKELNEKFGKSRHAQSTKSGD
ncbi:hypothetical protein RJ035_002532 [Blastomyces gilchristii]